MLARLWSTDDLREFPDIAETELAALGGKLHEGLALSGLLVDEEAGGFGANREFATVAAEELGAGLAPYDLLGPCVTAQMLGVSEGGKHTDWMSRVAEGSRPFVFAWPGGDASWSIRDIRTVTVSGEVVSGRIDYVLGLIGSPLIAVPALSGSDFGIAVVDGAADGVSVTDVARADSLCAIGHLSLERAHCAFLPAPEGAFTEAVALAVILLAAEMVGAARSCIERMVEYGLVRKQFGQPIITFQALKHDVVDAAVDFERARASVYRAAKKLDALSTNRAGADVGEVVMFARIAKASAGTALRSAAKQSIQLHGGTGFTWENLSHRYLKKWVTANELFGSADAQRRLIYAFTQTAVG
jgi:alkylation response protein AidB-like acyl-CoA dehydrogenase